MSCDPAVQGVNIWFVWLLFEVDYSTLKKRNPWMKRSAFRKTRNSLSGQKP